MYESVTLSLTSKSTLSSIKYFPLINVCKDSKIGLRGLKFKDTFQNITDSNNQMLFKSTFEDILVTIENGYYDFNKIRSVILTWIRNHNNKKVLN